MKLTPRMILFPVLISAVTAIALGMTMYFQKRTSEPESPSEIIFDPFRDELAQLGIDSSRRGEFIEGLIENGVWIIIDGPNEKNEYIFHTEDANGDALYFTSVDMTGIALPELRLGNPDRISLFQNVNLYWKSIFANPLPEGKMSINPYTEYATVLTEQELAQIRQSAEPETDKQQPASSESNPVN